jgi:hypothetical protein
VNDRKLDYRPGPYRVEQGRRQWPATSIIYELVRSGEGALVQGSDSVLLNRICDLLNEDEAAHTSGR